MPQRIGRHLILSSLLPRIIRCDLVVFASILFLSGTYIQDSALTAQVQSILWFVQGGISSPVAQANQDARPLEPGKPLQREPAGGQSHSYQFTLTSGQYLHVIVDQRGERAGAPALSSIH
jgi:hypothetical protein